MEESQIISEPMADNEPSNVISSQPETNRPAEHKEQEQPLSRMDAIEKAAKEIEGEPKEAEKAEKEEEPEEKVEAKKESPPEKAEKETVQEKPKAPRQSEGRRVIEAPERFHPKAKEVWQNVPHPVREEFERVMKERDAEIETYRESKAFREELKEFEEITRSNGTTIKEALTKYAEIDNTLRNNPSQGLKMLFNELNMTPQQAFGNLLAAYNVTPEDVAAHYRAAPHEYTALAQRPVQHQTQQQYVDPTVAQMQQQVQQMQQYMMEQEKNAYNQKIWTEVIGPLIEEYPKLEQLRVQVAEVLNSGIIEKLYGEGLSPRDEILAAYRWLDPEAFYNRPVQQFETDTEPADDDLRGKKSVRGAPSGTAQKLSRGKMSRTDSIMAAAQELGIRF